MGPRTDLDLDGIPLVRLESDFLQVDIAPSVGGRVVSLIEKRSGYEFLWRNSKVPLQQLSPGSEYDPNFFGGIDELLPNDIPETIAGIECPDHGELWTTPLEWHMEGAALRLHGTLPRFGLDYERLISLRSDSPKIEFSYRLSNFAQEPRVFLWKLHAAVNVQPGDIIECPARRGEVADLAWSRFHSLAPFSWPEIEGQVANVVPPAGRAVDFFYLSELERGEIAWHRPGAGFRLAYEFDTAVFPYAWLFASYGGFDGHYTVILEPCTTMPISVNAAANRKQCSRLEPGECLETKVRLSARFGGEKSQ